MATIIRRLSATWLALVFLMYAATAVHAEGTTQTFAGKVVGVTDGDTIEVMREGKAEKVRLNGVDCPESNQDFGSRAKQFTSSLVFGKEARVIVRDTDRYGRLVGDVVVDGKILNHELVKEGLAWWYRQYAPNDAMLELLENEARVAKKGLWSQPKPIAPWDFRRGAGGEGAGGAEDPAIAPPGTAVPSIGAGSPPAPSAGSAPAVSTTPRASASPAPAAKVGMVYGTRTGKKYHAAGCRYLAKSKVPMSLSDAKARGLTACSVCGGGGR